MPVGTRARTAREAAVITVPLGATEKGVPTAVIPFDERPSNEDLLRDAVEVLAAGARAHHGEGFFPEDGWRLRRTARNRYELVRTDDDSNAVGG